MSLKELKALYHDSPVIHLNNAGMSPPHPVFQKTMSELLAKLHQQGCYDLNELFASYHLALESFAKIIGCTSAEVAMMSTCAAAISQTAFGIPLEKGQEILTWDQEYPSNAYPWLVRAQEVGAKVVRISSNTDWTLDTEKLCNSISPETRVIAVSWVQYQTGSVSDLKQIVSAVKGKDIWVVVDVMQGLGVLPFDMTKMGVDVVCGATQKWMCGPVGHGFLAVKKERIPEIRPLMYGAMTYGTSEDAVDMNRPMRMDARRFEPGAPLVQGTLGASAVIEELLKIGIDEISKEALRLAQVLQDALEKLGCKVLRKVSASGLLSPIVTALPPHLPERAEKNLNAQKITYAKRAGGFRFSPHAFNNESDLEKVIEALSD